MASLLAPARSAKRETYQERDSGALDQPCQKPVSDCSNNQVGELHSPTQTAPTTEDWASIEAAYGAALAREPYRGPLNDAPRLSDDELRSQFQLLQRAKSALSALREQEQRQPSGYLTQRIETVRRVVAATRNYLVESNLPLATWAVGSYCRANSLTLTPERFDDLHPQAVDGLLRAVDCFDPERGKRFGGYACLVMRMQIHKASQRERLRKRRFRATDVEFLALKAAKPTATLADVEEMARVYQYMREVLEQELTERERAIVCLRFGIDCEAGPMVSLASQLGVSRGRIGQLAKSGLRKITEQFQRHKEADEQRRQRERIEARPTLLNTGAA